MYSNILIKVFFLIWLRFLCVPWYRNCWFKICFFCCSKFSNSKAHYVGWPFNHVESLLAPKFMQHIMSFQFSLSWGLRYITVSITFLFTAIAVQQNNLRESQLNSTLRRRPFAELLRSLIDLTHSKRNDETPIPIPSFDMLDMRTYALQIADPCSSPMQCYSTFSEGQTLAFLFSVAR